MAHIIFFFSSVMVAAVVRVSSALEKVRGGQVCSAKLKKLSVCSAFISAVPARRFVWAAG